MVHLATIPITGTGINPAGNLDASIISIKDIGLYDHILINDNYIYKEKLVF
ncbi:hypothetical protein Fmac_015066 [Flemingia macrophylla]|uniref:Uncharacterized protein n=1 Tax=Flemingia macrophylla TaxID=520843 RepID=A0ABD1MDI5_9FABA